jgi:hypothetical protein
VRSAFVAILLSACHAPQVGPQEFVAELLIPDLQVEIGPEETQLGLAFPLAAEVARPGKNVSVEAWLEPQVVVSADLGRVALGGRVVLGPYSPLGRGLYYVDAGGVAGGDGAGVLLGVGLAAPGFSSVLAILGLSYRVSITTEGLTHFICLDLMRIDLTTIAGSR